MSFWDLLRPTHVAKGKAPPPPATPDTLRAALAQAQAEARSTEEAAAEAATNRAAHLLVADDAELDELDRRLAASQRQADRAAAAVAALEEKLAAAEEAERVAGLDAIFADGQAALDQGLAAYKRYGVLAAEVAQIAETMADKCDAIEAANKRLRAAGDPRSVPDLDASARPEVSDIRLARLALWHQIELPSGEFPHDWHWPKRPPQPRVRNQPRPIPGPSAEPPPPPSRLYVP